MRRLIRAAGPYLAGGGLIGLFVLGGLAGLARPTPAAAAPPADNRYVETYVEGKKVQVPLYVFKYVASAAADPADDAAIDKLADKLADKLIKKLQDKGVIDPPGDAGGVPAPAKPAASGFAKVLAQNCANCHTEGTPKGNFVLFDKSGKIVDATDWCLILDRVTHEDPDQVMPPPPKAALAGDDLKLVRARVRTYLADRAAKK